MQKVNACKALGLLHKSMLTGQLMFMAVCVFLVYSKIVEVPARNLDRVLQVIALLVTLSCLLAGNSLFKQKTGMLAGSDLDVKNKFDTYRKAIIIQWALLEVPSIFSIICFFLTGNYAFLALTLVLVFLFLMQAPVKNKIALQLQVSETEIDAL